MAFNIRVYGLLIENGNILVSDENKLGRQFTKFPGGGLKFGEGLKDCLVREFNEELGITVLVKELFYITDFFQESAFNKNDQVISVYYKVTNLESKDIPVNPTRFDFSEGQEEVHRWVALKDIHPDEFMFPIDQLVVKKLQIEI